MTKTIIMGHPRSGSDESNSGLLTAVFVLLAALVTGVILYQTGIIASDTPTPEKTDINITIPTPATPDPVVPDVTTPSPVNE